MEAPRDMATTCPDQHILFSAKLHNRLEDGEGLTADKKRAPGGFSELRAANTLRCRRWRSGVSLSKKTSSPTSLSGSSSPSGLKTEQLRRAGRASITELVEQHAGEKQREGNVMEKVAKTAGAYSYASYGWPLVQRRFRDQGLFRGAVQKTAP